MGSALHTIVIGEQMRDAAEALKIHTGVPYTLFERLTGLEVNDRLVRLLMDLTGQEAPRKIRRQRSQLVDAMLDGHFHFGGKKIALGAEPDLLATLAHWFTEMGAHVEAAVTTTHSPILEKIPTDEVLIGDLEDLEKRALGADLLVTHSHGRQAATRLGIPLYRVGIPMFDRVGAAHQTLVGYRGTRNLIFELANLFLSLDHEPQPDTWANLPEKVHASTAAITAH